MFSPSTQDGRACCLADGPRSNAIDTDAKLAPLQAMCSCQGVHRRFCCRHVGLQASGRNSMSNFNCATMTARAITASLYAAKNEESVLQYEIE